MGLLEMMEGAATTPINGFPKTDLRLSANEPDAAGVNVAIVGGTGGLGQAMARYLLERGAVVTVVGRSLRDPLSERFRFIRADLGSIAECERVADQLAVEDLDVLIFTTGIITLPEREKSADGIEIDMAVSYVSRYVILHRVAERLGTNRPGKTRVFVFGFPGTNEVGNVEDLNAEHEYKQWRAHMNTVAANEALVLDASRRYPGLSIFGVNPGLVSTGNIRAPMLGGPDSLKFKIVEGLIKLGTPSPERWARRVVPALFAPELADQTGFHINRKGRPILPSEPMTEQLVASFRTATEQLLDAVRRVRA